MREFSPAVLLSPDDADAGEWEPEVALKRTRSTSVGSAEAVRSEIREYERERAKLKEALGGGMTEEARSGSSTRSGGNGGGGNGAPSMGSHFPQIHLFSGVRDDVVPFYWSNEFLEILEERGVDARSVVFDEAAHLDFIACFSRGTAAEKHDDVYSRIRSSLIDVVKASDQ